MYIQQVDRNRDCFSDYTLEGTTLSIGGISVDLVAEQGDQENIITFSSCNGMIHRGMMPCCKYVAEVLIPPRRYELMEVANERNEDDEDDEEPGTHTESVAVPLDLESVVLKVWPVEDNQAQETMVMAEGESNAE
jgi:hypothetical protein